MKTLVALESAMNVRSRQRGPTTGTLVGTRFQAPLLEAIDSWRKEQDDLPTRPEAVRRLVKLGMAYDMPCFAWDMGRGVDQKSNEKI